MERLPDEVLENAILTIETTRNAVGEESAFEKCVYLFLKELKEYRSADPLPKEVRDEKKTKVTLRIELEDQPFEKLVQADRVLIENGKNCVMCYQKRDTATGKSGWISSKKLKPK